MATRCEAFARFNPRRGLGWTSGDLASRTRRVLVFSRSIWGRCIWERRGVDVEMYNLQCSTS